MRARRSCPLRRGRTTAPSSRAWAPGFPGDVRGGHLPASELARAGATEQLARDASEHGLGYPSIRFASIDDAAQLENPDPLSNCVGPVWKGWEGKVRDTAPLQLVAKGRFAGFVVEPKRSPRLYREKVRQPNATAPRNLGTRSFRLTFC